MYWNIFKKFVQTLFLHVLSTLLVAWLLCQEFVCIDDYEHDVVRCRPKCNHGKFSLFGMAFCYPWLSCPEIDQIEITEEIGYGAVKQVHCSDYLYLMHLLQFFWQL